MTADLRQIIATARQMLLDGDVEDALEILHADDAAPPDPAPVTRYERDILIEELERLKRELREANNQVMNAYVHVPNTGPRWPIRMADHFETPAQMRKWADEGDI